jgi:hypothetical protein
MNGMDQATDEQWHVQVEAGDVRLWTLDQLDAAFKAELVDESTFVLEVGKTEWMQLGTLLGLDGEDDEPEEAPVRAAAPVAFKAPVAPVITFDDVPAPSVGPYSTAPMASDIDYEESPASFRRSRKGPIVFGVALAAAGVAAFALTTRGHFGAAEAPAETTVAAAAPPPAPPPAPAADPQPAAESPSDLAARLSHDQLLRLADADRAQQAKVAAQQKARAAAAPAHHALHKSKEKSPFHSGGDKYDPLNAKL